MSMAVDSFAASVRRFSPRLLLSELLLKQWFEPVVPFTVMIGLWAYFALTIPDYASVQNSVSLLRLFAEFGFVALAMGFCLVTGGIDLSVGAIFALCNFAALYFLLRSNRSALPAIRAKRPICSDIARLRPPCSMPIAAGGFRMPG